MEIRLLTLDDLPKLHKLILIQRQNNGADGEHFYTPFSRHTPFDQEAWLKGRQEHWQVPLTELGWQRTWGLVGEGRIWGDISLESVPLPSENHRLWIAMGLVREVRGQGWGSRMLRTAIEWAQQHPESDWIDLGVFSSNTPAIGLYRKFGFTEIGRKPDRFRVDGTSLDDITMTLNVGTPT